MHPCHGQAHLAVLRTGPSQKPLSMTPLGKEAILQPSQQHRLSNWHFNLRVWHLTLQGAQGGQPYRNLSLCWEMIFKSLYSSTLQAPLSWPDEVCGSSWETKTLQLAVQNLGISCEVEEGGAGSREDHFFCFLGDERHPLRDPPARGPCRKCNDETVARKSQPAKLNVASDSVQSCRMRHLWNNSLFLPGNVCMCVFVCVCVCVHVPHRFLTIENSFPASAKGRLLPEVCP